MSESLCKLERRILQVVVLMETPDVLLVRWELLLSLNELHLLLDYLGCKLLAWLVSFHVSFWTLLFYFWLAFFRVRLAWFLQIWSLSFHLLVLLSLLDVLLGGLCGIKLRDLVLDDPNLTCLPSVELLHQACFNKLSSSLTCLTLDSNQRLFFQLLKKSNHLSFPSLILSNTKLR